MLWANLPAPPSQYKNNRLTIQMKIAHKTSWRREWQPTPVFLPGESHGQRSLGGLQSMGWHRVRHDLSDLAQIAARH